LRYEALVLREIKSARFQLLQVSPVEWLKFVEDAVQNGFHAVAVKVTINAFYLFVIMCNWRFSLFTDFSQTELLVLIKLNA
jgi:hypothetical protein